MARAAPRTVTLRGGARIQVRSAEESDAPALVEHDRRQREENLFSVREPDETGADAPEQAERIREHLEGPGMLSLLAIADGGLIGRLSFRNGKLRRLAHHGTFGISVEAPWRGRGVGRALIATLLDWAALGDVIEKVCLGCFATNTAALGLYRSLGFVEESRSARYFRLGPGAYIDDVQMCIWVKPGLAPPGFGTWPVGGSGGGAPARG